MSAPRLPGIGEANSQRTESAVRQLAVIANQKADKTYVDDEIAAEAQARADADAQEVIDRNDAIDAAIDQEVIDRNNAIAASAYTPPAVADQRIMANISGGSAVPSANELSDILDDILGTTQGALLYRNETDWVKLDPGTAGQYLKTGGASANPAWGNLPALTLLETIAATSGTTKTTSADLSGCTEIWILGENISASGAASPSLNMEMSDDGTTFTTPRFIMGTVTASVSYDFIGMIYDWNGSLPVKAVRVNFGVSTDSSSNSGASAMYKITTPTHLRFSWSAGQDIRRSRRLYQNLWPKIVLVPVRSEYVSAAWPLAEPFIRAACRRGPLPCDAEELREACEESRHQLWIYERDNEQIAAAVTGILREERVCVWLAVGGDYYGSCEAIRLIEEWARSEGCVKMRSFSRPGMLKRVPHEYRTKGVILERKL